MLSFSLQDTCSPNWKTLQDSLLDVTIAVSSVGITYVALFWVLMAYGFYKHLSELIMKCMQPLAQGVDTNMTVVLITTIAVI